MNKHPDTRSFFFRLAVAMAHALLSTLPIIAQNMYVEENGVFRLTAAGASHLAKLPLKCLDKELPYKTGIVFDNAALFAAPKTYHPAFYGCFDWHSSVHGHWMLVRLLKRFPDIPEAADIRRQLTIHLSAENIKTELVLFQGKDNKSFERIYGWSWLLELQRELKTWDDPLGKTLAANLQPLADHFAESYVSFLPKLVYPIRVGEHTNLAFGLRLAWDYAALTAHKPLQKAIRDAARRFYENDRRCPVQWEPGGYDFLSPCLEEADLMWRVLSPAAYRKWVSGFLPGLFAKKLTLFDIGLVRDRSDGKLVHLDGLNLSRAWCLYGIARHAGRNEKAIRELANKHLRAALPAVASGDYAGEHWLASFAVYALTANEMK